MLVQYNRTTGDSMFDVMNADQLIQAVRRRRAVWDPRHIGHNNRLLINKLWQEVANELAIDKNMAKSKWRGLRDYYRQEMKKQTNYLSDHGTAEYRSSWALFDQMSFVKNTILPRRQREHIATMISAAEMDTLDAGSEYYEDDPITICIPKLEPQLDLPEYLPAQQQQSPGTPEYGDESTKSMANSRRADKLQMNNDNDNDADGEMEIKRRKLALLERTNEENANDDLQFFKSLLPDMANLPRAKKSYIRLKIQEIIHREVHGNEGIVKDECS